MFGLGDKNNQKMLPLTGATRSVVTQHDIMGGNKKLA